MTYNSFSTILCGLFIWIALAVPSFAQNTGGVFGPAVNEGHKSLQYRVTANPESNGWAQRLHYQQSINDDLMWRIVGATKKTAESDLDFDFVQGELFWELTPNEAAHRMGLRFDGRIRNQNRPGQLGVNFMNQFSIGGGWTARALALTAFQVGSNSADGVFLGSRANVYRKINGGQTIGLEMYNNYGTTEKLGSFKTQGHTIGPFISAPISDNFSIYGGAQIGVSNAAPDAELRLWLTNNF